MLFLKTFLKPLTPDEEKDYLRRYKEGDLEAKNILIERNLRLVAHIVKKYQQTEEDLEDLISIGTIGLIKAVTTFDSQKGNRLATYAARCIDNELLMMLRSKKKTSREISLYEPIGNDTEGNEINLIDILEYRDLDVVERLEFSENSFKMYQYFKTALTEREQMIIKLRYGLFGGPEVTQKEIARQLGISRSYVSRIEKKALLKLKERFNAETHSLELKKAHKDDIPQS